MMGQRKMASHNIAIYTFKDIADHSWSFLLRLEVAGVTPYVF
jgi:hypothetical protein